VVYGPTQPEGKEEFLTEFVQVCHKCKGAAVIGGDFNIIRSVEDNNKPCILPTWSHTFNSIIEISGLKEVKLIGRKYTWANNLPEPTFEKLDRVLIFVESDLAYHLAVVTSKNRNIFVHVPLMLKYGSPPPHCNAFRYEN
jgi:hypothetical protein